MVLRVLVFALSVATLALAIACDDPEPVEDVRNESLSDMPSPMVVTPTPQYTTLQVSNLTKDGIRVVMAVDFPSKDAQYSTASGYLACYADASVLAQYGKVVEVLEALEAFDTEVGESIYLPDGTPTDASDPTLASAGVYRDNDGRLIVGWRHCEDAYPTPTPE